MNEEEIFEVPVTFIFSGGFHVKAASHGAAEKFVKEDCWAIFGYAGVQPGIDEDKVDWDIELHADKALGRVRRLNANKNRR